jgi:hypothetical protein
VPAYSTQQGLRLLYVSASDSTCQRRSPCFATVQAAMDAATPGETIQIGA